jgi:hypothetical protein
MKRSLLRPAIAVAILAVVASLPALADTRIEKNLKLDPGGKLTVLSDAGSITVTGTGTPGAHVLLTSTRDDLESRFDIGFEELPGEVRITMKKKESLSFWSNWFSNSRIAFEIQVPVQTRADLSTGGGFLALNTLEGDAKLSTSGGHIEVTKLTGNLVAETSGGHIALKTITGDAKVETSGGHIEADGVTGNLSGETSGGHIEIANVGKDIHVATSGGGIEIRDAHGRVEADTSGGSVTVSFAKGNSRGGKIESSGGGIRVSIDPAANLNIDASTSGGSVRSDVPVKVVGKMSRSSIRGSLGNGGELLYVHTSGGSVTIAAADGSI